MESIDTNLFIDLIKNQKLIYEHESSVLKEGYILLCEVFHLGLLEDSVAKRLYSVARVYTEKEGEIVMYA